MKIIITEEQKTKLFIPRNINKRYSDWNKDQSDITINGHPYRFNQYDLTGNKIGVWLKDPDSIIDNYNNTNPFMKDIFNKLELKGDEYVIGNERYMIQELKNGYLYVNYYKIWSILMDQYSLIVGRYRI
jgi:hypothetical protein